MHFVIFEEDKKKKTVQHVDLYEKQNDVMLWKMKPMCILQGFDPYLEFPPPHTHKKEKNPKETQAKGRWSPLVLPRNSPISQRSPRVPIFCCKQCPFQSELYHRHTQRLGVRSNYPLQCGGAKATEYLVWFPNPLVARKVRWGPCLLNIHGTK